MDPQGAKRLKDGRARHVWEKRHLWHRPGAKHAPRSPMANDVIYASFVAEGCTSKWQAPSKLGESGFPGCAGKVAVVGLNGW